MPALDTSYKSIIKLALPIIFGAFVQSALLFTDSFFLSEFSRNAFSAVGNAGLFYITFYMLGSGLADAGQIYLAGKYGKDDFKGLKRGFQTNVVQLLFVSILLLVLLEILRIYVLPEAVRSNHVGYEMDEYLRYRPIGYVTTFLTLSITSFYIAIGRSNIMLYNTLILCGVNAFLDYVLIFGNYGFPELGSEGASIATVIAESLVLIFSFIYLITDKRIKHLKLFDRIARYKDHSRQILRLAYPLMAQGFLAVGAWTTYFFMIEQRGTHEIEVSQIVHKLYWLALIPMFGFAAVTRTYASNLLSLNLVSEVKKTLTKIMIANYLFLLLFIHGNIIYPEFWISVVYNPDIHDPKVIDDTRKILFLITGSILIHAAAMVYQSLIAGAGKTLVAFKLELISIAVYLSSSYLIIFVFDADIVFIWATEYIYFGTFLALNYGYYRRGTWKTSTIAET